MRSILIALFVVGLILALSTDASAAVFGRRNVSKTVVVNRGGVQKVVNVNRGFGGSVHGARAVAVPFAVPQRVLVPVHHSFFGF